MIHPKSMLLAAALLTGAAYAAWDADDTGKKKAYSDEKAWTASTEEVVALFDQALGSCCATGACAESGECEVAACAGCEAGECTEKHVAPAEKLVKLVSLQPSALASLRPHLEERFLSADTVENQRHLMLELLSWCEADEATACGEKLYKARPAAFDESHLLTFTAKGSELFEKDLAKLAKKGRILPCAYYAAKGKKDPDKMSKQAVKYLTRTAGSRSIDAGSVRDQFVAATTLAELGEKQYLPQVRLRVHDAVLAALDEGQLDQARAMTLQAEFFTKSVWGYGSPQGLGSIASQMQWHVAGRSKEVATADDVFELIETITPM